MGNQMVVDIEDDVDDEEFMDEEIEPLSEHRDSLAEAGRPESVEDDFSVHNEGTY